MVMGVLVLVLVDIVIVYISSLGFGNMGQMRTGAKKKSISYTEFTSQLLQSSSLLLSY